jgi:hypothetical protein
VRAKIVNALLGLPDLNRRNSFDGLHLLIGALDTIPGILEACGVNVAQLRARVGEVLSNSVGLETWR